VAVTEKVYWVYILLCENNSYYAGYTTDLVRRFAEHVQGSIKCKYTRSFKPLRVAQCWEVFNDLSMAMQAEKFIKRLSKRQKVQLIEQPELLSQLFVCHPGLDHYLNDHSLP
jgi:putative endonuclease